MKNRVENVLEAVFLCEERNTIEMVTTSNSVDMIIGTKLNYYWLVSSYETKLSQKPKLAYQITHLNQSRSSPGT